jgi:hypothetical protein
MGERDSHRLPMVLYTKDFCRASDFLYHQKYHQIVKPESDEDINPRLRANMSQKTRPAQAPRIAWRLCHRRRSRRLAPTLIYVRHPTGRVPGHADRVRLQQVDANWAAHDQVVNAYRVRILAKTMFGMKSPMKWVMTFATVSRRSKYIPVKIAPMTKPTRMPAGPWR